MMTDPSMVFSTHPRHGLLARSGWEQDEARTVLRDLGWEWTEELHALVPPDDVPTVDAGVEGVAELHRHGHSTGYSVGPYGAMRLSLARAEQVFALAVRGVSEAAPVAPGPSRAQPTEHPRPYPGIGASREEVEPPEMGAAPPAM